MLTVWTIILWLAYHVFNVMFAILHKSIVIHRQQIGNKKQIEHGWWGLIYCVMIAPMWFIMHDWYFIGSLLLLHFHVFGGAYSWIVNGNSPFYLSKTSSAITERLMVWMRFKSTEVPYILSCVVSIALLIKACING